MSKKKDVVVCRKCGKENPDKCPTCHTYLDTNNINVGNSAVGNYIPNVPICRECGGYCYECGLILTWSD